MPKLQSKFISSLTALLLSSTILYPSNNTNEIAIGFVKKTLERFQNNPNVKFSNIGIKSRIIVPEAKGMTGYIVKFNVAERDKTGHFMSKLITDSFYVTEKGMIATEVFTSEGRDLMVKLLPNVDYNKYYTEKHLVAGDFNATNKILLFSDPFCPFCRESVPLIIKKVQANPQNFALFMFEYPLPLLHPGAELMISAMMQAKDAGQDITINVYTNKAFESLSRSTKWEEIVKVVEKETGFKCDIEQLKKNDYKKMLLEKQLGDDIAVSGTPFLVINKEKVKVKNFLNK